MRLLPRGSKSVAVFASMTAMAVLAFAAAQVIYQTSGTSSFKLIKNADLEQIQTTTQNYETFATYNAAGDMSLVLVDSATTRKFSYSTEGVEGSTSWSVRSGDKLQNLLWKKTEPVSELLFDHESNLVISGQTGCCAEMTGYRAFDLTTGKLIVSYNSLYILTVPNSPLKERFIGVITPDTTRDADFVAPVAGTQPVGLIKYNSLDGNYQKYQIDMPFANGYASSLLEEGLERDASAAKSNDIEIREKRATLWNIDAENSASKIEGVALKLVFNAGNGDQTLLIPVVNDKLDLSRAQIPAGVSVRQL